jgi:hypothetical protein
MTEEELKLKCLELGQAGQPDLTVRNAQTYYDWIKENDEKPKRRGRPPKSDG